MIAAERLTKDYGDKRAVDDLSFVVQPGLVTGFLGPNGSGKSTTMRLILGLDAPTAGRVTVNGKPYREHPAPLHEVGALLEARSVHTGRSAYNHLLALAQTHGIPRRRVDELIDLVGCARSPASAQASSRWAWASGSASPRRCSATRTP
jgi:ABC-2 type transport system ATP-binding protein